MKYIDILMNPDGIAYQEVVADAFAGLTDLPVVYIDGERRLAGALTTDMLASELTAMGVKPNDNTP